MPPGRPRPAAPAVPTAAATLLLTTLVLLSGLLAGQAAAAAPVPTAARGAGEPLGGRALDTPGVVQAQGTTPLPEGLTGAAFVVADLDSGDVLAARDPHGRYGPASTIKTLTALALIPVLDPDAAYTATADDVDLPLDSSRVGVVAGVSYPVRELFEGLLLMSGNDAANALAGAAGGTERALALMSAETVRLQARDTVARTPHGLDAEGQVSSAYDLALIARAAMQQPDFAQYVATRTSSMTAPGGQRFEIGSKNRLLWNYEGALGIKNGYTQAQRASFVGAAERDGRRLVVTVMRAEPAVWKETASLLDWGFAQPRAVRPVGELVEPLRPAATAFGQPAPAPSAEPRPSGSQSPLVSGEQSLLPEPMNADDGGSWPARLGAATLVLLGTVAGLRVRAVRRRRRRRALARPRVRPGAEQPRGPGQREARSVPRRPPGGGGPEITSQPARRAPARLAERAPASGAVSRTHRVG